VGEGGGGGRVWSKRKEQRSGSETRRPMLLAIKAVERDTTMIPGRPSKGIGPGDGDGGQRAEVVDGTGEEESVESVEGAR
jgi:hypothetical protein